MTVDWQQCRENLKRREAKAFQQRELRRQQARSDVLAAIAEITPNYPLVQTIYLFGSVTQPGHFHQGSDIDVAVEGSDAETYFALWRDLERACPDWEIDLREINTPSHFTDVVQTQGELVYERPNLTA